jgi:hypothetical protein
VAVVGIERIDVAGDPRLIAAGIADVH